jgi:hypothetical protein
MGGVIDKRGGVLATPAAVNGNFMLALKDCMEHDVEMGGRMGACQTRQYVRNLSTNTGPLQCLVKFGCLCENWETGKENLVELNDERVNAMKLRHVRDCERHEAIGRRELQTVHLVLFLSPCSPPVLSFNAPRW